MREVILHLPVKTQIDLAKFERDMCELTLGYSLIRSMSYSTFRRMVLMYQLTGQPNKFKATLVFNHYLSVDGGMASLYRIVDEDVVDHEDYHTESDDESGKKRKRTKE